MLYAICVCVDNGWPFDQEILKKNNIKIGDKLKKCYSNPTDFRRRVKVAESDDY